MYEEKAMYAYEGQNECERKIPLMTRIFQEIFRKATILR